jgi:predicted enzyme related to lactoylglutathione lyase
MSQRDSIPVGAPCWVELLTSDLAKSTTFYGELFGWTAKEAGPDTGGYVSFHHHGVPVAGCMPKANLPGGAPEGPDGWSVYLVTPDARATAAAAADHGGQVCSPAMDVMDLGTMVVVADPGNATIGVWEPKEHKGFAATGEPGTPYWFELHTRDYDAAVRFYRDVFGWDTYVTSDTDDLRYTTLGEGDGRRAGIIDASGFLAADEPAHWVVYYGVADVDATLARVIALGGMIVEPAVDTPYGRLAKCTDVTGALFKLAGI